MEFRVQLSEPLPDPVRLAEMLEAEDSAAVGEFDDAARAWRVNTTLASGDLLVLLGRAGSPVTASSVTILPSVCCGGCSG